MTQPIRHLAGKALRSVFATALGLSLGSAMIASAASLADKPVLVPISVAGNLALALSVEWPTAVRTAHVGEYSSATNYLGYFDPRKCYGYVSDSTGAHFKPEAMATTNRTCTGKWSGNFLNWASTPTIDPFRWAMTGGRRVVDLVGKTILEKAWHSGQGDLFRDRDLTVSEIAGATPLTGASRVTVSTHDRGFKMRLSTSNGSTDYNVRVRVCDATLGIAYLEANCKAYGTYNYKPEGLIQQYADKMRYSAFGYLNDSNIQRDGAVLRARQKFVSPHYPSGNAAPEWDPETGIYKQNPDTADATATGVSDSGVMNYLNKFGQLVPGDYKSKDPVNELFYAALRYYRNLGDVPAWSNTSGTSAAAWIDGFPVIKDWRDPITHGCQRNFILGIGDIYTHADKNIPGNTRTDEEPTTPGKVTDDPITRDPVRSYINATDRVGVLQGMGSNLSAASTGASYSSDYMAGMAFDANALDIRSDLVGKQTVQTYWVDVLEQSFRKNNKFYLAAKYGGLDTKKLPADFDPYTFTGPIPLDWWSNNGEMLTDTRNDGVTQPRPDNYFAAGQPDTMVAGLREAFKKISNEIDVFTTSFSLSALQVESTGAGAPISYGAQYDSKYWSGVLKATQITFDTAGNPKTKTEKWSTDTTLKTQLAGNGWNTNRRVVTWNGTAGTPFRHDSLTSAQQDALDTLYNPGSDGAAYLNYLRGDRSNERTDTDATKPYRQRARLLGDIVNAKVAPVGPPGKRFSEAINPGYAAYKKGKASRPTMVYVGANDGMLHAFDGTTGGATSGAEQFAYVPSALFQGPSGTPQVDGLAQLGNPSYQHHNYVDATPKVFDVDFNTTFGNFTTTAKVGSSDWRSILIGGLGKGGKSYYAIDVSDPAAMTDETKVAAKVLWEFSVDTEGVDKTMGFSFGAPNVVKTRKYGWVVVLTSGYNNGDNFGYIYFVNPKTGALLEKVATGAASDGLAQASIYVQDFSDNTADAVYAGDLNGQLWRFDVTAARGSTADYPAGVRLAQAKDASGKAQPITTAPLIEIYPKNRKRFVLFGTGRLLDIGDISATDPQTFYGILDGNAAVFAAAPITPIARADLKLTDPLKGVDLDASLGWYIDLVDPGVGVAWRLVLNPTTYNGIVSFAPLLTAGDACKPAGSSRTYAMDFGTGKSVLTKPDGTIITHVDSADAITDVKFVEVDGKVRLITGDVTGEVKKRDTDPAPTQGVRLLNWREVPMVD